MTESREPSRREFIAASALSLVAMAGRSVSAGGSRAPSSSELLYAGMYTEGDHAGGIHLLRFDTGTGVLQRIGAVNAGPSPSFLAIHPGGHTLYAVNEVTQWQGKPAGGVSAFDLAPSTGELNRISEQSSEGGAPCYVSVDRAGRVALVANYVGGNIAVLPIMDGTLGKATHVVQHAGKGPNAERQEAPHAHCIVADPTNRYVLAVDLGVDRVLLYRLTGDGHQLEHVERGDAVLAAGSGPRHIAFHPTLPLVYVANELNSTVSAFRFNYAAPALTHLATHTTLPRGWSGENYPADIHADPSGRHLYLSNRGHNSIAVFDVTRSGALTPAQHVTTGGDWPRNFSLDPTGRWLLVGNQRSGTIVVLRRDAESGRLATTGVRIDVPRVACLRFRAHTGVTA